MAKIKKFQFKNIRSYGNKMVDIPFDMDNGLVLIQGKNGGGKTSIVEALEFAIYGKSSRVPVKDLPNWINDNAFTTIEFETDDNRKVELSRGISPDFYDLKVGGSAYSSKTKSENRAGKNKIDKMVEEELFGLAQDIFSNNVLLSVQDFKSFIKMKTADKRKIIDKIFDTDIFNDMLVKLKEELSDMKKRQSELSSVIETKQSTLDVTNARIDEIKATITDDIDSVISDYQNKIVAVSSKLNTKVDELSKSNETLDGIQSSYNTLMSEYNKAAYDLMLEYNQAIAAIDKEYNQSVEGYMASSNKKLLDELSVIDAEKKAEIDTIPNVEDSIQQKVSEITEKIQKIAGILAQFKEENSKKLDSINEAITERNTKERDAATDEYNEKCSLITAQIADYQKSIQTYEIESQKTAQAIKNVTAQIAVIDNKLLLYKNDKCPECGADLHDDFHSSMESKMRKELEKLNAELELGNKTKENYDSAISVGKSNIEKLNSGLAELKSSFSNKITEINSRATMEFNDEKNKYMMSLTSMESQAKSKTEQFNNEIKSIRETATSEYNIKLKEIENKFDTKINFTRNQYTDAYKLFESAIKNEIDEKKSVHKKEYDVKLSAMKATTDESAEKYISEIESMKSSIKVLGEEVDMLREKLQNLQINLTTVQNGDSTKIIAELQVISDSLTKEIESMKPELEDVEHKILIRENTQALIGENGLKKMIMRNILPQFNASIQKITSLFDFKYRFVFDDNFDAHLSYCGKEVPITVSRGEEKIMDIIVILSTLQLILLKHPNINMLFLDEIFSNLDVENIAKAVSILKDYSRKYNLIVFVMSHTTVPVELFDKTINISFDGSFSSLEIN